MSVKGDFSKFARIQRMLAKAPQLANDVARRAASSPGGRASFTASGTTVQIEVTGAAGPPRRRRSPFWSHGFELAKGFMPPQWMQRIKRAADDAFRAMAVG